MRPADWEARALAWFRSLTGDQRRAVVQALDPTTPAGQQFARLTYDCLDDSAQEAHARQFKEEGIPALKEAWSWLTGKKDLATVLFLLSQGEGLRSSSGHERHQQAGI